MNYNLIIAENVFLKEVNKNYSLNALLRYRAFYLIPSTYFPKSPETTRNFRGEHIIIKKVFR